MDYILSLYNWSSDIKTSPFRIYSLYPTLLTSSLHLSLGKIRFR
nr:MAG TPA: hypothetical protein [Caudoviricetes sp.]